MFQFSEPVLCAYIDLDNLIAEAGLSDAERWVVNALMRGHSGPDIAEHRGTSTKTISAIFRCAVQRIVAANNLRWRKVNSECRGNNLVGEDFSSSAAL